MRGAVAGLWLGLVAGPALAAPSYVYEAETSQGTVKVFRLEGSAAPGAPVQSFGLYPGTEQSLAIDAARNLFLADSFTTWAYQYAPRARVPTEGYPTRYPPFAVGLFGTTLYVQEAELGGTANDILAFAVGQGGVVRTLSDAAIASPQAMAVDGAGNVIVAYYDAQYAAHFGVYSGGEMPLRPLALPGLLVTAMAVDAAGNLVVASPDYTTGRSTIRVFAPGAAEATMTRTGLPLMNEISFAADGRSFFTANARGQAFERFAYPSARLIYAVQDPDADGRLGFSGVAVSPALVPGVWFRP